MRILAVLGSPKGRGAGYEIIRKIEAGMKAAGGLEFEYLFLRDANLKMCTGCYQCMARGEERCPLKDDCAAIEQKLTAADGIILSSPVYVNNVSALMKNFIDRFAYLNHRPKLHRQKVLAVANVGGTDTKETLAALKLAVGGARGLQAVHELAIATPPWPQTERAIAKKERAIEAAAQKFYQSCLDTSLPPPAFSSYVNFLIFKELSFKCRQSLPADYEFYKDKAYYFDAKIPPVTAAAAKAFVRVMMYLWKDLEPGNVPWPVKTKDR